MLNGTPYTNTSAANAAATIALPALPPHLAYQIESLQFSYSAAPTGGLLTIADGTTIINTQAVTNAGPGPELIGIRGTAGRSLTITLAAGGAGVVGRINVSVLQAIVAPDYAPDADATAFLSAAGIADAVQRTAIDQLVKRLKENGTWGKYRAIYPLVGGNARSHSFNLKDPRDLDAAFRVVWSGDLSHSSEGVRGRGGWGNTFYSGACGALGFYSPDPVVAPELLPTAPATVSAMMGFASPEQTETVGNPRALIYALPSGLISSDASSYQSTRNQTLATGPIGFYAHSYSPSVDYFVQRDRTTIGASSVPATALGSGTSPVALLSLNAGATGIVYPSRHQCSLFFIADYLTRSELANDAIAFQSYQAALGRAVRGYGG